MTAQTEALWALSFPSPSRDSPSSRGPCLSTPNTWTSAPNHVETGNPLPADTRPLILQTICTASKALSVESEAVGP